MISTFYGDNFHVNRCLSNFLKEKALSDKDIVKISNDSISEAMIKSEAMAMSIIAQTRVILVENFFSSKKDSISEDFYFFIESFQGTNYIIFLEEGLLASNILKKLKDLNINLVECFGAKYSLREWIISESERKGTILTSGQAFLIESLLGTNVDLFQLEGELDKITSYDQAEIDDQLIKKLYKKINKKTNIFTLTDAFGNRNYSDMLKSINELSREERNSAYVLIMIMCQFRNIILVKELKSKGFKEDEIAKKLSIHPYVVKKSISHAVRYTFSDLKKIYSMLVEVNAASFKTGGDINTELSLISYWVGGSK